MNLFTPNTDKLDTYFAKAKYLMAWRIALTFCILFLILIAINSIENTTVFIISIILFVISCLSLVYLKFTTKYNHLFWLYTVSGTVIIHFSINTVHGFTHFVDFLWIMAVILLTFIGLGKRIGFIITLIHGIAIAYFYQVNLNTHLETIVPLTQIQIIFAMMELFLCLFCISYLVHQYIKFNSFFGSKLKSANDALSKKNEENVILVKEIHHRVKNNLQIIISLLRLQKGELKSDEAKRHFNEAINRIMVMSLIHKKLYQESEMAHVEIKPYLDDLSNDVIHISNLGLPIKFEINSQMKKIGLKTIVPLGLLINELLSNSIKHAFAKRAEGNIIIDILAGNEDDFTLKYSDDGTWIEPDKDYTGFGLGLIQTLAEQLEGSFTRNQSEYSFTIKNLDN